MGLFQSAANDTRPEDVSRVEGQRALAGGEAGRQALGRASPRSAFAALILDLSGGSFAFIMATGIVSIAAMRLGHGEVGAGLFILNLVAFPLLCVLMLVRLCRHPLVIFGELRSHRTGAGFLTAVAATSIVGDQFVLFASNSDIAAALWLASVALWVGLIYAFFIGMTIQPVKPPLATGLDGAWLLTAVATEAIAILATHVSGVFSRPEIVVFVSLCLFLLGGVLYLILISLIVQRWLFEPMQPQQLTLPYWINMRGGDHGRGWSAPLSDRRHRCAGDETRPADRRRDRPVLGHRHLVDSAAGGAPSLAPCDAQNPSSVSAGILVHGVSARHVYRGNLGFIAPVRPRISCGNPSRRHLDRFDRLAFRLCRDHKASMAPASPRTEELRAW
jgi:hypothetical protein